MSCRRARPSRTSTRFSPGQWHHIRHGAQRHKLAVHLEKFGRVTPFQGGTEFEGNARTAQVLEGAFIIGTLGVHHGHRLGQYITGQMVVGDHKVQSQFPGTGRFLHRRDTVIHRDDQLEALLGQRLQRRAGQAVTAAPGRQFAAHMGPLTGKTFVEDGCGGNTVHVVIAVDDDELLPFYGTFNALHRLVHVPQQERVRKVRVRFQQLTGLPLIADAAGRQYPAQQYAAAGSGQFFLRPRLSRLDLPGRIFHRASLLTENSSHRDSELPFLKSDSKSWVNPSWRSIVSSVSISVETSRLTSCSSVS